MKSLLPSLCLLLALAMAVRCDNDESQQPWYLPGVFGAGPEKQPDNPEDSVDQPEHQLPPQFGQLPLRPKSDIRDDYQPGNSNGFFHNSADQPQNSDEFDSQPGVSEYQPGEPKDDPEKYIYQPVEPEHQPPKDIYRSAEYENHLELSENRPDLMSDDQFFGDFEDLHGFPSIFPGVHESDTFMPSEMKEMFQDPFHETLARTAMAMASMPSMPRVHDEDNNQDNYDNDNNNNKHSEMDIGKAVTKAKKLIRYFNSLLRSADPNAIESLLVRASKSVEQRGRELGQMDLETLYDQVDGDMRHAEMMVMSVLDMVHKKFFEDVENAQ